MDIKRIHLIRHGAIVISGKRYIGQSDVQLSNWGRQQAFALKEIFRAKDLDGIYCSDLRRAHYTACIISSAHGLTPISRQELREINVGEWEGELVSEIKRRYPISYIERGNSIDKFKCPNGESFQDCSDRVIPIIEEIIGLCRNAIIVAHAGVNRVVLCHFLGLPLSNVLKIEQSYGCMNLIEISGTGSRLKYLNRIVPASEAVKINI